MPMRWCCQKICESRNEALLNDENSPEVSAAIAPEKHAEPLAKPPQEAARLVTLVTIPQVFGTMLLLCDYQNDILGMSGLPDGGKDLVAKVNATSAAARKKGVEVGFVRVAFRPGYPEVSERNRLFKTVKANSKLVDGTEGARFHAQLEVLDNDPVFTKRRVGAFSTTDLEAYLRARSVTKLVIGGVSTGGVVLTTVLEAFDSDYELTVLSDLCHDRIPEQGENLMTKVLPNKGTVCDSTAWLDSLI